ncbi:MAG: dihydroorotate dehydrogenase-like protein [Methyloceanibacter sp.]|jgi:dihydroorotate dehydrogenase (fumarate)|uniref:dihydroorotate dehydrogenase-like protein n=1 Tax=Methyloceanibacter sp. TaxID=1965321 RepID=UPI0035646D4B
MNLSTRYLGLELKHPIVASPSPLTRDMDGIRKLLDAGAAAIVVASVFEEQVNADRGVLDERLETVRQASKQGSVPIMGSLNGETLGGWVSFATQLEEAGASAIELDLYRVPSDPNETGQALEESYVDILRAVKSKVKVPVAVKLSPYFSAPANMAKQLVDAGADGLVLFNRFYEGDIDLTTQLVKPDFRLSTPYDSRLPLMWISLLSGRLNASLAATSGVWTYEEVVKDLLVGADAVMTTSSLLKDGPQHLETLVRGLREWMEARGFDSLADFKGQLAAAHLYDPSAFMRVHYSDILTSSGKDYA